MDRGFPNNPNFVRVISWIVLQLLAERSTK
jgi:hypothetical protein